jgi:hypothetical protein
VTASVSSVDAPVRIAEPVSPGDLEIPGTPILVAAFESPREFLEAFAAGRGPAGELAVRTRASPTPGTHVIVEITWPGLPNRVFARAFALRRWLGGHLILGFEEDETAKRDYLVRVAGGDLAGVSCRVHRRFLVRLPLTWRRFGEPTMHDGIAEDLSSGGLLIVSAQPAPPAGERVAMRVRAEAAYQEIVLTGEVRHGHMRADGRHAFGVGLKYRSNSQQRTLRALLRTFAARGLVIVDPSCD